MRIDLKGNGKVSKKLEIKREKQDEAEVLHCHLVVQHIEVKREVIDAVCNQRRGWASEALYDELGAPRMRFDIRLKDLQLEASGEIRSQGGKNGNLPKSASSQVATLELAEARVTKIRFELVPNAALLSARFTWDTAGDEADDVSGLLGRDCTVAIAIEGSTQQDLARPGSEAVQGAAKLPGKGKRRRRAQASGDLLFGAAAP